MDRDRSAKAHMCSRASVTREGFAGAELAGLAEKLSAGSLTPLLSHLVDAGRLTAADLDDLRATLAARDAGGRAVIELFAHPISTPPRSYRPPRGTPRPRRPWRRGCGA